MRLIDGDVLKAKLEEHHDFFIKAWEENGVDRLSIPIPDKSRIDEIDNCIAEVVNAPTVERPHGRWIVLSIDDNDNMFCECSACGAGDVHAKSVNVPYCWKCGAEMEVDNECNNIGT